MNHHIPPYRKLLLTFIIFLGLLAVMDTAPCSAALNQMTAANLVFTIDTAGTATVEMTDTFSPLRYYNRIKQTYPDLAKWFREQSAEPASVEIPAASRRITCDDRKHCLNYYATWWGAAVCRKERWEVPIGQDEKLVMQDGTKIVTAFTSTTPALNTVGVRAYILPPSARDIVFDTNRHTISYSLAPLPAVPGAPELAVSFQYKPQLMSALYKIYADPAAQSGTCWVAKTIFRNTGAVPVYNLKITYKLGEYSETSISDRYTQVVPGGTVVDLYYPVISARVTELKTKTPAQLYIKYEYSDASGGVYGDEIVQPLDILGINQFLWSNRGDEETDDGWKEHFNNAPLVAAFVTRVDDAVKQFAGFVSQAAEGAGAALSDPEAVKWLKAAYNLQISNNIVYQTPSGYMTTRQGNLQEIKFPRDVFRDKSGTCIDLAVTYAALAESVGLHTELIIQPGHCFPVIILPSGKRYPVEITGIGGGNKRSTFEQAVKTGRSELEQVEQKPFIRVDVESEFADDGIANPEFPPLPADFFKGYQLPLPAAATGRVPNPSEYSNPVFVDDFNNPKRGWYTGSSANDAEKYLNGRYEMNVKAKNLFEGIFAPSLRITGNCYSVRAAMEMHGDGDYGIIFNATGWNKPHYIFKVHPKSHSYSLYQRVIHKNGKAEWESLIDWTQSDDISMTGQNTLQILQEGNTVQLYVNDRRLDTVQIDSYAGDIMVGLGAGSYDTLITAGFTKFTVNTK